MSRVKKYIETSILRKREEMEWLTNQEDGTLIGFVVRRTPRTYRRVARLVVTNDEQITRNEPEEILFQQKLSRIKAKPLAVASSIIRKWLIDGWIVKEVKLSEDGRTPIAEGYVMGPALFYYEESRKALEETERETRFLNRREQLRQCLRLDLPQALKERINHLSSLDFAAFKTASHFRNWPLSKRLQFLDFVIAILTLSAQKQAFDFKEIGAFYYKEIGGSKVFDRNQVDFVSLLETWLGESLDTLGLVSHGRITPVYFVGEVRGQYASYGHQTLQAITDIALMKDSFETPNQNIWLVENRAILTRMAAASDFLKNTASIVICIDGHIRSAHRRFIEQLSNSPKIEQVIIWTDYDLSGLLIAEEAFSAYGKQIPTKWIASDGSIYKDYALYKEWLHTQLEFESREQEEVLGDEVEWTSWIQQ